MLPISFVQADEHFGGMLDILVNNVGTNIRKATVDFTAEEFSTIMDTNFNSIFFLTQVYGGPRYTCGTTAVNSSAHQFP